MSKKYTSFATAVKMAFEDRLVLCNKIPEIDGSIWDNMRQPLEDEEGNAVEVYQWFILAANESDIDYFEETFDGGYAVFSYSDLLECWIMGVTHFGTPWPGVEVKVIREDFPDDCLV